MSVQRVSENYFLSLALAVICVILPVLNWFSLSWGVLMVLRRNAYVGFASLASIGFLTFCLINGLRIPNCLPEWLSLFTFIAPLWAMAYSLRWFRVLRISLQLGFFLLLGCALISYALSGPMTYDELYTLLQKRLSLENASPTEGLGGALQQAYLQVMVTSFLVAWPAMLFLMQVSLLLCARFVQSRWYNPGGFQQEFHALRLSIWMSVPFVLSFLWVLLWPSQIALQVAGLIMLLFSFAGIAVLHWFIQVRGLGKVWVVVMYGLIFVLSAWALPGLAVIALVDSLFNIRQKLQNSMH